MYYGDKKASLVVLMSALSLRGWKIYGFKEDKSDSMTDYYDPASWEGIAVKNGYILVVDNNCGGSIGGSFVHKSYEAKIAKRINKLISLRDNHAASEGEKANAQSIIDNLDKKVVEEIVTDTGLPEVTYQANPGNSKWHIERDDKIIAKGTGVFGFSKLRYSTSEERYIYKNRDNNETCVTHYYNSDEWPEYYNGILRKRDESLKVLKKLDTLLVKWTNFSTIKLGNGPSEYLVKKTVQKKYLYYIAEDSDNPTKYFRVGDRWKCYRGIEKGLIYMLDEDNKTYKKLTKKWKTLHDDKSFYTYKPIPNKSTKAKYFFCNEKEFNEGNLVYVNLVKKEEISEETVYVKALNRKKVA